MTDKQKIFINEYLIDLNATRAYKVAYPNVKKTETAAQAGSRLLRNVNVSAYLAERMKEREKRTEITQDSVVEELAAIAFSKVSDYAKVIEKQAVITNEDGDRIPLYDEDGIPVMVNDVKLQLTDNLSESQLKALSGIKQGKFGIEVSICDKLKALELLGKHLGMFTEKLKIDNTADKEKAEKLGNIENILKQMRPEQGGDA